MIDSSRLNSRWTAPSSTRDLVDGTFRVEEARDLTLALLDSTAALQKLRNLRSQVNLQERDDEAAQELERLEQLRAELERAFGQARSEGLRVRLRTTVELEIGEASFLR